MVPSRQGLRRCSTSCRAAPPAGPRQAVDGAGTREQRKPGPIVRADQGSLVQAVPPRDRATAVLLRAGCRRPGPEPADRPTRARFGGDPPCGRRGKKVCLGVVQTGLVVIPHLFVEPRLAPVGDALDYEADVRSRRSHAMEAEMAGRVSRPPAVRQDAVEMHIQPERRGEPQLHRDRAAPRAADPEIDLGSSGQPGEDLLEREPQYATRQVRPECELPPAGPWRGEDALTMGDEGEQVVAPAPARAAIRRPPQDGQNALVLQENGTRRCTSGQSSDTNQLRPRAPR